MRTDGAVDEGRRNPAGIDPDVFLRERYQHDASRRRTLNAYYAIKPLLPRGVQIRARRLRARRAGRGFPAWPIEPLLVEHQQALLRLRMAEQAVTRLPLVNLWPDGRRFAVVVTHDVESAAGVENIPAVLEVEARFGVVSSWNFVAEWYPIAAGTFERVRDAGGEIGLHGIRHDGRLFSDRTSFERSLTAIRRYMSDWDAVGFRSPSLHRNSDWMAELGCLYDSSFPDTDPFEPQPGGCCSILPYFLDTIVELPVTMVQDHTLWEILQEPTIDIWRRKADWLIANGGLINVLVHPDYVLTPARLESYAQLLAYLRDAIDKHAGWHALPRDVASWWTARTRMRVLADQDGHRVVNDGPVGEWGDRATLAWASDRDGVMHIDV